MPFEAVLEVAMYTVCTTFAGGFAFSLSHLPVKMLAQDLHVRSAHQSRKLMVIKPFKLPSTHMRCEGGITLPIILT